jgi:O-antigen/teichoic acid export membrane protein
MIGIVVGYFFMKIKKLGAFAVGGWLGYVVSLILYSAFLYKIQANPPEVFPFN